MQFKTLTAAFALSMLVYAASPIVQPLAEQPTPPAAAQSARYHLSPHETAVVLNRLLSRGIHDKTTQDRALRQEEDYMNEDITAEAVRDATQLHIDMATATAMAIHDHNMVSQFELKLREIQAEREATAICGR